MITFYVGSKGHDKLLAEAISHQGGRVIALFDNNSSENRSLFDVPIVINCPKQ